MRGHKDRRDIVRGDSGAVAVIVALLLVALLILGALVVDVGYWYNVRRQLQSAADAAALAGCWELIKSDGDQVSALNVARDYAEVRNSAPPADGLEMIEPGSNNPATNRPYTKVTAEYVKVTVKKRAPVFLSAIIGYPSGWIMAQSRADAQFATGIPGAMPWAIPIIGVPKRVTVSIGGGPAHTLSKESDGLWHGYGIPAGKAPANSGYPMTFTVYNSLDVPTYISNVAGVVVRESTAPFTDVRLDRYVVQSGDSGGIDVFITSAERPAKAKFNGVTYQQPADFPSAGAGVWRLHLPSPTTAELSESFALDVEFGQGNNKYTLTGAAYIVARRSTFPIKDIDAAPHTVANAAGTVNVDLELNQYEYGKEYELKVTDQGGVVGNFCAIDLSKVFHPPNFGNPDPAEYDLADDPNTGNPVYLHYLQYAWPFILHMEDIVWTQPGGGSSPQTDGALDFRFDGDTQTWTSWNNAVPPRPPTKRLVYVPVVELAEITTGQSPLRVVGITAFFINPAASYKDVIRGYFVEYVAGGLGTPTPPASGYGVRTPRLVPTEIDF